jgi:hypothetical protein
MLTATLLLHSGAFWCCQAGYSNLVDTSDGFDGWVASKLPVET